MYTCPAIAICTTGNCAGSPDVRADLRSPEASTAGASIEALSTGAASQSSGAVHDRVAPSDMMATAADASSQHAPTGAAARSCSQTPEATTVAKCEWASDGEREVTVFLTPDGTPEEAAVDADALHLSETALEERSLTGEMLGDHSLGGSVRGSAGGGDDEQEGQPSGKGSRAEAEAEEGCSVHGVLTTLHPCVTLSLPEHLVRC
jgi:hypothetical protein